MLSLRRWGSNPSSTSLHSTGDPAFPVDDPFLGHVPDMLNRIVTDSSITLHDIESVQVRGSEDVTRVEHLLEKGGTVIWADVKPATVLSVFVRGVRALPKSARVFSGDRDFKRLQKALRVSDKVEGLASVRQKLDPKKRDLLQIVAGTYATLAVRGCSGDYYQERLCQVVSILGAEILRLVDFETGDRAVVRDAMLLFTAYYMDIFGRNDAPEDNTVMVE